MIRLPDLLDDLARISHKYEQAELAADVLRAVSALHQPDCKPPASALIRTVFCESCTTAWPCPTARALGDRDGAPA